MASGLDPSARIGAKDGFTGREALLRRREQPLRREPACPSVDDGQVLMGSGPVFASTSGGLGAADSVGFTSSTGYGDSLGTGLAHAWLPTEPAEEGTAPRVAHFGESPPATVPTDPAFGPETQRLRC